MEHYLDFQSVVLRLLLAVFLGGLIGFERTRKRYPAGFRTYLLVCLGSALAMMFGQYNYYLLESSWLDAAQAAVIKCSFRKKDSRFFLPVWIPSAIRCSAPSKSTEWKLPLSHFFKL